MQYSTAGKKVHHIKVYTIMRIIANDQGASIVGHLGALSYGCLVWNTNKISPPSHH